MPRFCAGFGFHAVCSMRRPTRISIRDVAGRDRNCVGEGKVVRSKRNRAAADDILRLHSMRRLAVALMLWCAVVTAQDPAEITRKPVTTPEDLAAGERIYRIQCAYCHGAHGEGGRGATLARPRLVHAPDDDAMFQAIARGIPDTEMPGRWVTVRESRPVGAIGRDLGTRA